MIHDWARQNNRGLRRQAERERGAKPGGKVVKFGKIGRVYPGEELTVGVASLKKGLAPIMVKRNLLRRQEYTRLF